ncbi:MAG: aldolase/citrate lyase family protein [Dehalococcoidia bacterium]
MRLRSIVRIPPDGAGLDDALASPADALLLTVADARRPATDLRADARAAIGRIAEAGKAALVVVNHPRSQMLRDDIEGVVQPGLSGVLLTHAVEPQDVRDLAALLRELEMARQIEPGTVAVFPVIDTARGLLRAAEIAAAAPRVAGVVLASGAYARDIGAREEESGPRLAYARGAVVAAARAVDGLPLIEAGPLQLREMAQYGFAGAILPDAASVALANPAFTPAAHVLDRAAAAASAYDAARSEGAWVARIGEEVVDASTARRARQLREGQEG